MNKPVLYGFRAWCKLADRNVQIAINDAFFRRPVVPSSWLFVKEIPYTGRKPEHWQKADVCESLAQRILREHRVDSRRSNPWDEILIDKVDELLVPGGQIGMCVRKQHVSRV
jgi:hypothetical protein